MILRWLIVGGTDAEIARGNRRLDFRLPAGIQQIDGKKMHFQIGPAFS